MTGVGRRRGSHQWCYCVGIRLFCGMLSSRMSLTAVVCIFEVCIRGRKYTCYFWPSVFGHTPPVRPLRPGCSSVAMRWPAIACKLKVEALPPSVVPGPSRTRAGDGHSGQEAGGGRSGGGRRDCGRPTHPSAGESFTTTPVDLCPGGMGMGMCGVQMCSRVGGAKYMPKMV